MADCCANASASMTPMILACAGGSNVGQMSNRLAVELTKSDYGKLFCLAGIGAGLPGFVQSARDTAAPGGPGIIAIDGCPVACVKKVLENAGIVPAHYVTLTELGMTKDKCLDLDEDEVNRLLTTLKTRLALERKAARDVGCGCGCR
ncbi:DGC domain protein [Desulfovibrio sp. X2]|uniref:putative zinc-binding protein n=1 Tax=Desulfovibrio sp. X2 TaxID=941449 RepID=UPI00035896C6|nr:putative zinc-binding protein [Desulfovibrio sp. X2]EPR37665.1 DGC domain protein [Desulfovibrio sp. X2]